MDHLYDENYTKAAIWRPFLLHDLSESASHQIPDRQCPHLIRCGYGAGALCKKENPALWLGFVKMGDKRLR
ncbi:hypothetical protein B9059_005020 [Enterobacter roggenkampii]|uniref:Uncharacterized protein n=1 Tax=Enterobacter roggenkampii TaxID=1812935 RepID=A0AAX1WL09_9ENTR|nr:hypothetical protein B9059_005020 [Enterobacter roggenkampii]